MGLNYARMYHCRSVVGYANEMDPERLPLAPQDDGLYRIDVMLFDYRRKNTTPFIFHLRTEPNSTQDLVLQEHNALEVRRNFYHEFEFEPLPHSKDQAYSFCLEAPQAELRDSITIIGTFKDVYPQGRAVFRDMWGEGIGIQDLDFRLVYRTSLPLASKIRIIAQRLTQYKPSLLGDWPLYALLGTLYLIGLYALFVKVLHLPADSEE